jgi:MFS transporter, PPP family, 3-phenylpropionic acid transporter
MRPARAFYFLYYAALAALMPYLAIYFSIVPLVSTLGATFWTEVADASGRHRSVLVGVIGMALVAAFGLSLATHVVPLALLTALLAFHLAPAMPLLDHAVLEALGDRAHAYGRQRVWGALGWAAAAPLAGWATSHFGLSWSFFLFLAVMPWVALIALRIPYAAAAPGKQPLGGGLVLVLRDARWVPFLLAGFAGGVGLALVSYFLPLHLRDLGASYGLIGIAVGVPALSEIPFMVFGGMLLSVVGPRRMLIAAVAVMALRLLLTGVITDHGWLAAAQVLHGPSFGVLWIAGVAYARELAPEGRRAVAQGLFTAVTGGLGGFAGSLLGGVTFDALGGSGTFLVAAAFTATVALLLAVWRPAPRATVTAAAE